MSFEITRIAEGFEIDNLQFKTNNQHGEGIYFVYDVENGYDEAEHIGWLHLPRIFTNASIKFIFKGDGVDSIEQLLNPSGFDNIEQIVKEYVRRYRGLMGDGYDNVDIKDSILDDLGEAKELLAEYLGKNHRGNKFTDRIFEILDTNIPQRLNEIWREE